MEDLNPFRLCSGFKVLGHFMIVLVLAIIAVSYYAIVIVTWGPHLLDGGFPSVVSFPILLLFHILLGMLIWCYFMVVFHDPGSVPPNWKVSSEQNVEEGSSGTPPDTIVSGNLSSTLSSTEGRERRSSVTFCNQCQISKPPRCHHCSVCQRCVLKMDHHCIWIVNCVGARNHKFFLLFLVYTFLETAMDTLVLLPSFIGFFKGAKHHSSSPGNLAVTFLAFVLNLAFALSLLCFVIMHATLVLRNTTSIEVYEKKKGVQWKYDIGWRKNLEQVFGTRRALLFLPLFSKEDLENVPALHGLEFPVRADTEA